MRGICDPFAPGARRYDGERVGVPSHTTTLMEGLQDADPAPATGATFARPGDAIGRYVVTRELGRGGMGRVLSAVDPRLERKVAIKVLHRAHAGTRPLQARLLREGQALARLSHPNVVQVFEAGRIGDDIFIAMESIDGPTLRQWQSAAGRDATAILAMYRAAGRGLAVAHALGLVHRDFKPDNVLVDDSGQAKVVDFGLARAHDDSGDSTSRASSPGHRTASGQSLLDTMLTQRGTVMGTPPYIAPDVYKGGPIDARADQFAFCVSLYEALFGALPYAVDDLKRMAPEGARGPAPARRGLVDRHTIAVLRRGLAPDPAARWPSMDALLHALTPRRSSTRNVAWAGGALLALAGLTVWAATPTACPDEETLAEGAWPSTRRAEAVARLGEDATTLARMDASVAAWARARQQACRAEPDARDARTDTCLDETRAQLDAAGRLLATQATPDDARHVVTGLRDPSTCTRPDALARRPTPPTDIAAAVASVREELASLVVEISAGSRDLVARSADALRRAEATSFGPVVAEARQVHGSALARTGDTAAGVRELSQSFFDAQALDYDALAASAGVVIVGTLARASQLEQAERWIAHTRRAIERAGNEPERVAALHAAHGLVEEARGEYDEAATQLQAAIDIGERDLDIDRYTLAGWHNNLGTIRGSQHRIEEAIASFRRGLELREAIVGPAHAEVGESKVNIASVLFRLDGRGEEALTLNREGGRILRAARGPGYAGEAVVTANEAAILDSLGRHAEATPVFAKAVEQATATFGPEHPDTISMRAGLAGSLQSEGKLDEARPVLARALEDQIEALGPDHARVGATARDYGELLSALGDDAGAIAMFEDALRIADATQGPDSDDAAAAAYMLGAARRRAGETQEAIALLRRASASWQTLFGPGSHKHTVALGTLGGALLDAGRLDEAEPWLTTAGASLERIDANAHDRGRIRFDLARLYVERGDPNRAQPWLAKAREDAVADVSAPTTLRREVEAFAQAHPDAADG